MKIIRHLVRRNCITRQLMPMIESRVPVVVIIGATGCGKTKLSLEIAQQFNGEIISADSMQVYKGLDIVTNKATVEERQQIRHHLIDFLEPMNNFSVVDFRNKALDLINELRSDNKLPIIVGGTNYYIESVLWKILVNNPEFNDNNKENTSVIDRDIISTKDLSVDHIKDNLNKNNVFSIPITYDMFEEISSHDLFKILEEIDPNSANRLHPNDKRKIIRCLQVIQQNKRLYSEIIEEQKSSSGGSELGGPLRFPNSVILWLDCDKKELDERLDKRVDEMIEKGLIDELLDFHQRYNRQRIQQNIESDYTRGIFQSIGFKEFHKYLLLSQDMRNSVENYKLLLEGIEAMKIGTKRYVNKQLKWIRNRFLVLNDREVPNIYRLNTTNLDEWQQRVTQTAIEIVNSYISQSPVPETILPLTKIQMNKNISKRFHCDICEKFLCGSNSYELHMKSKGHKHKVNEEKHLKKQKYYQLMSLLNKHKNNLIRRNSI